MRLITLAGVLFILAGCTLGNAVSAIGSVLLSGGLPTAVDQTTECHAE